LLLKVRLDVVHHLKRQPVANFAWPTTYMKTNQWRWACWACVLAVLVLALMPAVPNMPTTGWDKSNHVLAFAVLAILADRAYPRRLAAVMLGLLFLGALIEVLQSFTPDHVADWQDLLADGVGLLVAWVFKRLVG
jgi:VanZ family protein